MQTSTVWTRAAILISVMCCVVTASCAAAPMATPASVAPVPTNAVAATDAAALLKTAVPSAPTLPKATVEPGLLFEIVAQGDPMVGKREASFAVAVRAEGQPQKMLADLPDEAKAALGQVLTKPAQPELYLVIYGGRQPSSRYAVKINSIALQDGRLKVVYEIAGPPPGQGAADVITYPYAIARVSGVAIDPADVTFIEQKSAP